MLKWVTAAMLLVPATSTWSAAPTTTTGPTTRRAGPATRRDEPPSRHPAIQPAVTELIKEIESALRSNSASPRTHSDYFQQHPAADLQPPAVLAALRRQISSDPRVVAYVKWQLLSSLPADVDAETAAGLVQAYRAAPLPLPRPGIEKSSRDELERLVRNSKADDEERVTEQFEEMVEAVTRDNRLIFTYREALFQKLPPSYDAIAAGFDDVVARLDAGASTEASAHARAVCKAVESWAASEVPREQMQSVARAVGQLRKRKGEEYYSKVYLSKSSGKLQWSKSQASLATVSQLEEVQEFLEDRIKNPPTPLKLKQER